MMPPKSQRAIEIGIMLNQWSNGFRGAQFSDKSILQ